jgi:hypothetical protein
MSEFTLRAGAAGIAVALGDDCFPNAESIAKYDDVYVRVIILETDKRYAFLTADMPSMLPWAMDHCRELLKKIAGVAPENGWVMCTNALSAPHTWPKGDHGQPDTPRPMGMDNSPHKLQVATRINAAYEDAYRQAIRSAVSDLREASIGFGKGSCGININKNIRTVEGWAQGVNPKGFADRTLTVLRINAVSDGKPIAIVFNYSCSNSVAVGPIPEYGGMSKVATGDIMGVASKYIEEKFGNGCTAFFMCGAMGDQVPLFRINYTTVDEEGKRRTGSFGKQGYVVMETLGGILGNAVVETATGIECDRTSPEIRMAAREYTVGSQDRETNIFKVKPVLKYTFWPDGERHLCIDAMTIGDIALVGLKTEMDGITVAEIRESSPFEKTLVASFVNGNGKSMPPKESYDLLQYGAINSPFVAGSAEVTRDEALQLLRDIKNK